LRNRGERVIRRLSLSLPLALSLVSTIARAQNTPRSLPDHWFDDDEWHLEVQYIITPEELSAFHQLKTTDGRDRFISEFWARRDPSPATPKNEFRDEYYRRVEYADVNFADPKDLSRRGMETDRGRFYVMFGPPDEIDRHQTESYEIWHYTSVAQAGPDFRIKLTVPQSVSCDGSYRIISPSAIASFQGVNQSPRLDGRLSHPFVQVFRRRFITVSIPVDFASAASVAWTLRTRSGDPVLENDDPILEGQLGPANNEPLSKHFLDCRMFGAGGMGFTHPVPAGSYNFSSVVTFTSGDVQRETVRFDVP
jgi:GWxTD domain-containing protein